MITQDEFRQMEGLRVEHATYLRTTVGEMVVAILREIGRPTDVPTGTDALASARLLSQYHGYNAAIDDLLRLAEPAARLGQLPDPQWGADPEQGDQLPSQVNFTKLKEMQDARDRTRNAAAAAAAARSAKSVPDA